MTLKPYLSAACLLVASFGAAAETSKFSGVCAGLDMEQCAQLIAPVIWNNADPRSAEIVAESSLSSPAKVCASTCDAQYYENFGLCKSVADADGDSSLRRSHIDACQKALEPHYQQCRAECPEG